MVVSIAARLAARKLAKKLARRKYYKKELSSLQTKIRARGKKTEAKFKFKQKPKYPGGGPDIITKTGYTGEYKVGTSMARRAMYFNRGAGRGESWRSEMSRVFGGMESGSRSIKNLHRSYAKDIRKMRKKLKLKLSGGGLAIGKNVDLSLL